MSLYRQLSATERRLRRRLSSTSTQLARCRIFNNFFLSWTFFILTTAFLGYLTQMQIQFAAMVTGDFFYFDQTMPQDPQTTVVISGYTKGGSNVVGEVLASRPESFYIFEPLSTMAESFYFKNSTAMCTTYQDNCGETTLTKKAMDKFRNVLTCGQNIIGDQTEEQLGNGGYTGEVWDIYRDCLRDKDFDKEFCDKVLSHRCERSKVKVIKTERLSTKLLGALMREDPELYVIHMFRDPRGIIFAHIKSGLHPSLFTPAGIQQFATSLCNRMRDDLEVGNRQANLYPKKFKLMLFEDFRLDMSTVVRPLFRFLGLPLVTQDITTIETLMLRKAFEKYNQEDNHSAVPAEVDQMGPYMEMNGAKLQPFYWRREIDMETLRLIETVCIDVSVKLGYNIYPNERKLRDIIEWPSYGGGGVYPL